MSIVIKLALVVAAAVATIAVANKGGLNGIELNCCTIAEYPIVSRDESSPYKFKGLALKYLQELQERLNFTCAAPLYEYTSNDTSFTRITEHMKNCSINPDPGDPVCKCQLGVGGWAKSRERIGRVMYLPAFMRLETDVLMHVDHRVRSTGGSFFVSAFTPRVWMLIGVLFLLFTFLRMMDKRFEQPNDEYTPLPADRSQFQRSRHFLLKSRLLYRLRKAAFRTAMEMGQQVEPSAGMERNSTRQWMLTFGIMLAGLFFVLTYEATMTALLVEESVRAPYRTADDFRKCNIDVNDICIPKGGVEESYWRNAFAHEPCMEGDMPDFIDSYDHVIEMVQNKTCKFVITSSMQSGDATTSKHCASVVKVGKPVFWGGLSSIMPLNANQAVFDMLRDTTLDLVEKGKITTLAQYYQQKGECFRKPNDSLSFPSLRIFFYVAFTFIFVMFMVMLLDPQRTPEEKREHEDDNSDPKGTPHDKTSISISTIDMSGSEWDAV